MNQFTVPFHYPQIGLWPTPESLFSSVIILIYRATIILINPDIILINCASSILIYPLALCRQAFVLESMNTNGKTCTNYNWNYIAHHRLMPHLFSVISLNPNFWNTGTSPLHSSNIAFQQMKETSTKNTPKFWVNRGYLLECKQNQPNKITTTSSNTSKPSSHRGAHTKIWFSIKFMSSKRLSSWFQTSTVRKGLKMRKKKVKHRRKQSPYTMKW